MAKILCVLYDDPVDGYPTKYARDDLPTLDRYPDGQTLPTPSAIDFAPGELLGSVSGELGLRSYLESLGHELIVTSDKEGDNSEFDKHLADAEIVISQPFWPAYLTAERIARAPKLKLAVTAGIGSDHVDLDAAIDAGITVAEVTFCNSISVAEHVVMMILSQVRNYFRRTSGCSTVAGISPTVYSGPMTSRACRLARSPPAGSGWQCCADWPLRRWPALLRQASSAR